MTITATNNDVDAPNTTVTVAGTSNGGSVANPTSKTLTITDDDGTPTVSLAALVLSTTSLSVTEAPGTRRTATYTVALASKPTSLVSVKINSSDSINATASPNSLEFTVSNWNDAQTVTVHAIDDSVVNKYDRETTIHHLASGGNYEGITGNVSVTVVDDDVIESKEMILSVPSLTVNEDSGTVEVTVSLNENAHSSMDVLLTVSESGTATGGGVDYTLRDVNLTIAEGELSDTVSLSIIEDKLDEEDETILLTARSTSPAISFRSSSNNHRR